LTRLKGLTLWGDHRLTGACLEPIGKLTSLEELTFIYVKTLTDDGLAYLKGLKNLRKVDFGWSRIGDEGIRHLTALPDLESIATVEATPEGMRMLTSFPNLKSLKVRLMSPREGQRAPMGATGPSDLSSVNELFFSGVSHLAKLQSLEELTLLSGTSILSDDDLRRIEPLIHLKRLDTVSGGDVCNVTDKGVESICKLRNLESLELDMVRATKGGLNQLSCLTKLESLGIGRARDWIEPDGVALDLAGLTNLRRLSLQIPLRDADLARAAGLRHLEWLDLYGPISEEALKYLKDLSDLKVLQIYDVFCQTGEGLAYLGGLKRL
jgi:hypothetical protein